MIVILVMAGCSSDEQAIFALSGPTMGTTYNIKLVLPSNANQQTLDLLQQKIQQAMHQVDSQMSTYKNDSELSQFNTSPVGQWFALTRSTFHVIKSAQLLSERSNGAYDVTVGPLVNLWGFGPQARPLQAPTPEEIAEAKERVGYQFLEMNDDEVMIRKNKAVILDLSSIAKGYGVDAVADVLLKSEVTDFLVEIGGELRASGLKPGGKPWRLAIESPETEQRKVFKAISVNNAAVATSGDYRNYYEEEGIRYSHTIDPETGKPVTHRLASVTVIDPSCMMADAMATMFMVMGEEHTYAYAVQYDVAVYLIYRDETGFKTRYSPAFEPYLAN